MKKILLKFTVFFTLTLISSRPLFSQSWISYTCYNHINGFAVDADTVWIGTDGGLEKRLSDGTLIDQLDRLDGLPHVTITDMAIDKNGIKWFVINNSGVASFDGISWTVFNALNSNLPSGFNYSNIHSDPVTGHIWVGTGEGAAEFDGNNWVTYNPDNSGLSYKFVSDIAIDASGKVWMATWEGLNTLQGATWQVYKKNNSGIPGNFVNSVDIGLDGLVWVGTNDGAATFDGINWTTYDILNSSLNSDEINDIRPVSNDEVWFATKKGASRLMNGTWETFLPGNSNLPGKEIKRISIDNAGNKWLTSEHDGAVRFDGTDFTVYTDKRLLNNRIEDFQFDHDNNLWVACNDYVDDENNGLVKFDGANWEHFTESNSGLPTDIIWRINVDTKNNIWLLGYQHMVKYDGTFHDYLGFSCTVPSSMYFTPEDTLWIAYNGTDYCALTHSKIYDGEVVSNYAWNSGTNTAFFYAPASDSQGNLWFCSFNSNGGVLKYTGSAVTEYIPFVPAQSHADMILVDAFDNIWCAGYSGFMIYDQQNNNWTVNNNIPNFALNSSFISSWTFDQNNHLWFSFHLNLSDKDFLYKYDGTNFTEYNLENSPLSTMYVNSMKIKNDGSIWFATKKGLMGFYPDGIPTNTDELVAKTNHLKLYPNPASESIIVETAGDESEGGSFLTIYNSMQQLVLNRKLNNGKSLTDISRLAPGIYLINLYSSGSVVSEKLVVQ